jgi:hypothetical protein
MGLAGMEDAQVKSGNGLVEREGGEMGESMSVADYAKMRQGNKAGSELQKEIAAMKERQKPLRALLEGRIKQLAREDMRYQ